MISFPSRASLTQGTIFSCALAEDYSDHSVYGLVITARCDIAQEKASKFNYLPVVPYWAWLLHDGLRILADRARKDRLGRIGAALIENGKDPEILEYESPVAVVEKLLPSSTKKCQQRKERCQRLAKELDSIDELLKSLDGSSDKLLKIIGDKALRAFFKELAEHRLLGFYYLPSIGPSTPPDGYVVLLREIHHLPFEVASKLPVGVGANDWPNGSNKVSNGLSISPGGTAMPVGCLQSPYIEHLMQVFTSLFSRIGLPDVDSMELYRKCNLPYTEED